MEHVRSDISLHSRLYYWRRRASEMQKDTFAFLSRGVRKPVQVYEARYSGLMRSKYTLASANTTKRNHIANCDQPATAMQNVVIESSAPHSLTFIFRSISAEGATSFLRCIYFIDATVKSNAEMRV